VDQRNQKSLHRGERYPNISLRS